MGSFLKCDTVRLQVVFLQCKDDFNASLNIRKLSKTHKCTLLGHAYGL